MNKFTRSLIWLAPLITLIGFLSYFLFFVQFPALRDIPSVNVPWVLIGAGLSAWALIKLWSAGSLLKKGWLVVSAVFSIGVASLLILYVFGLSYQVPSASEMTVSLKTAPDFTSEDAYGEEISLSDYRGKRVVLSFYRGFW